MRQPDHPASMRRHPAALASALALSIVASACGGDDTPAAPNLQVVHKTHTVASTAKPAGTPGSPGVVVAAGSSIARQFGTTDVNLNQVRYTRYAMKANEGKPVDAVLVAIPGTLAASHSYLPLAENLVRRMWQDHQKVVEVWGVDRRSVQLQDMVGLNIAERERSPEMALNFLFGDSLGMALDPKLPRRAVFHNSTDLSFFGNWTAHVHSQDIDAVVEQARSVARNQQVFLGGHSAGTGFVARYAATDFNTSGSGSAQPGYAKVKGLVMFEGPGGSLAATAPTPVQLDAVIAAADGGMAAAVAAGTEAAFVSRPGLTPKVSASTEITGMQIEFEGTVNGKQALLQANQGGVTGNNVYQKVADFTPRPFGVTAGASLGTFMDDDNLARTVFYSISMGALGAPRSDGLRVWMDNDEALPASAFRDHGAMPATVSLETPAWGKEVEPTNMKRIARGFFEGDTTYSDWYYPSSGLLVGNSAGNGGANLGLDTSALSLPVDQGGRGRSDIVNQTQARKIDVPVIAFGGTNGLTPVTGIWRGFAEAIAPCAASSCTAGTARTAPGQAALLANRSFGGVAGGFEVHLSEGYSHVDVLSANDDATNNVVRPLAQFIQRNTR